MAWYNHHICVGYKREYNLLNDSTGQVTDILVTLDNNAAMVKVLPGKVLLLAGIAQLGVMINFRGQPSHGTVSWGGQATACAYAFPYLLSMCGDHLEVHNLLDVRMVQSIPLPGAAILSGGA
jgi:hypothetical protein